MIGICLNCCFKVLIDLEFTVMIDGIEDVAFTVKKELDELVSLDVDGLRCALLQIMFPKSDLVRNIFFFRPILLNYCNFFFFSFEQKTKSKKKSFF